MLRYAGEDLGERPHIVVLGSCKVGNLIVSLPALEGLRQRFPAAVIGFLGSEITADFEASLSCLDWRHSWDSSSSGSFQKLASCISDQIGINGRVTLAINFDGFNPVTQVLASFLEPTYISGLSLDPSRRSFFDLGSDPSQAFLADNDWDSPEFAERYSPSIQSNYIAELFCFQAGVIHNSDVTSVCIPHEQPAFSVPDVLIHCTTARQAKVWPFAHWKIVVDELISRGFSVGLVGAPPKSQQDRYNSGDGETWLLSATQLTDLRGQTTLLQLAGACGLARAVISVDAGPMHIAAAMGTPTLAVVGNDAAGVGPSPIRLWLPRSPNVQRTTSAVTCSLCADNRFKNDNCLADEHDCMNAVAPSQVIEWLNSVLTQ
ncbi:glycosyltransferase family 9 protein [Synechococcus sp. LTW-G]